MLQKLGAFDFEKNYRKLLKAAIVMTVLFKMLLRIRQHGLIVPVRKDDTVAFLRQRVKSIPVNIHTIITSRDQKRLLHIDRYVGWGTPADYEGYQKTWNYFKAFLGDKNIFGEAYASKASLSISIPLSHPAIKSGCSGSR